MFAGRGLHNILKRKRHHNCHSIMMEQTCLHNIYNGFSNGNAHHNNNIGVSLV